MAVITGAIIAGGASLLGGVIGDVMSSNSAQSSNAAQIAGNQQMQQKAFAFDREQQLQAESYDTQMSNTAMQRRMADLKAAGVNPLLAISQGGASTPTVSGIAGPGGSVGQLQNPGAAFGNLGGQVSGAVQAAQQVKQMQVQDAQIKNTQADTAIKLAQGQYTGAQAAEQVKLIKDQEKNVEQDTSKKVQETWGAFYQQGKIQMDTMNEYQRQQFMKDVGYPLQTQLAAIDLKRAQLGMAPIENEASFQQSTWGKILNAIGFGPRGGGEAITGAATNAVRAAGEVLAP